MHILSGFLCKAITYFFFIPVKANKEIPKREYSEQLIVIKEGKGINTRGEQNNSNDCWESPKVSHYQSAA